MFGGDTDLSRIAEPRNLKRLQSAAGHVEHQWHELPMLEYLYVGFGRDIDLAHRSSQASPVWTMELE